MEEETETEEEVGYTDGIASYLDDVVNLEAWAV